MNRRTSGPGQRANWNQLRLTRSPAALVVNVTTTVWMPVAAADSVVVVLTQFCQPPVLLTGTLAITGPVVLSRRYCTEPVTALADASRVMTEVAPVEPKSTPLYVSESPAAMN